MIKHSYLSSSNNPGTKNSCPPILMLFSECDNPDLTLNLLSTHTFSKSVSIWTLKGFWKPGIIEPTKDSDRKHPSDLWGVLFWTLFIYRDRGREGERERNIDWLPLAHAPIKSKPATNAHTLTGNWTCDLCFAAWRPSNWAMSVRADL